MPPWPCVAVFAVRPRNRVGLATSPPGHFAIFWMRPFCSATYIMSVPSSGPPTQRGFSNATPFHASTRRTPGTGSAAEAPETATRSTHTTRARLRDDIETTLRDRLRIVPKATGRAAVLPAPRRVRTGRRRTPAIPAGRGGRLLSFRRAAPAERHHRGHGVLRPRQRPGLRRRGGRLRRRQPRPVAIRPPPEEHERAEQARHLRVRRADDRPGLDPL